MSPKPSSKEIQLQEQELQPLNIKDIRLHEQDPQPSKQNVNHPLESSCSNNQRTTTKHKQFQRYLNAKTMKYSTTNKRHAPKDSTQATPQQQTKEPSSKPDPTPSTTPKMTPQTTTRMTTINAIPKPTGRATHQHKNLNPTTRSCTKRQPDYNPDRTNKTNPHEKKSTTAPTQQITQKK